MKSDKSIRNICIAAIKRKTITPYSFSLTSFFEDESWDKFNNMAGDVFNVIEDELPIARVFIDNGNFTLVTTKQIITCQEGITKSVRPNYIISWEWNNFKGHKEDPFTKGRLTFNNNQVFEVFIETGKASMVMIYAIRTLIGLYKNA